MSDRGASQSSAGRASQTTADELYRRAAEARDAAQTASLAHVRAAQLRAAAKWTVLAQRREQQGKPDKGGLRPSGES